MATRYLSALPSSVQVPSPVQLPAQPKNWYGRLTLASVPLAVAVRTTVVPSGNTAEHACVVPTPQSMPAGALTTLPPLMSSGAVFWTVTVKLPSPTPFAPPDWELAELPQPVAVTAPRSA